MEGGGAWPTSQNIRLVTRGLPSAQRLFSIQSWVILQNSTWTRQQRQQCDEFLTGPNSVVMSLNGRTFHANPPLLSPSLHIIQTSQHDSMCIWCTPLIQMHLKTSFCCAQQIEMGQMQRLKSGTPISHHISMWLAGFKFRGVKPFQSRRRLVEEQMKWRKLEYKLGLRRTGWLWTLVLSPQQASWKPWKLSY